MHYYRQVDLYAFCHPYIQEECRSEYEVAPIAKKLKLGKLKDTFKGITLSDVINAAIGIAGLTV